MTIEIVTVTGSEGARFTFHIFMRELRARYKFRASVFLCGIEEPRISSVEELTAALFTWYSIRFLHLNSHFAYFL